MKNILLLFTFYFITMFSYSQCSYISGVLVNACGGTSEGINEMVTIETGSEHVNWNDISITFPNGGEYCNSCTKTWTTNSTYINDFLESDCSSENLIIEVGIDTDTIPPNSRLIIFTGSNPNYDFDFSNLCGTGQYYVMFANNTSTTGRYANSVDEDRTTNYTIGDCTSSVIYYSSATNTGDDGDGIIFDNMGNPTYVNSCDAIPMIVAPIPLILDNKNKSVNSYKEKDKEKIKTIMSIHTLLGQELYFYNYINGIEIDINEYSKYGLLIIRYTDLSIEKKIILK